MSYTVRYHPEGWRSAKDEPPEKDGIYLVAVPEYGTVMVSLYDKQTDTWDEIPFGTMVSHWQPLPTPPWEIMP